MRKRASSTLSKRITNSLKLFAIALGIAVPAGPAVAEPGFFNLTAPQHNAVMQWTHTLQWAAAPNATHYIVEMVVVGHPQWGSWSSPAQFPVGNQTRWGHNPDTLDVAQGRTIEWRVSACDANEPNPQLRCRLNTGGARTTYIPLAMATLTAPAHNSTAPNRTPDFSWRTRSGAASYRLIVNGSFYGVVGSGQCNPVCTFSGGQPISGAYAIWQVQACYLAGGGVTVCGEPLPNPPESVQRRINFGGR